MTQSFENACDAIELDLVDILATMAKQEMVGAQAANIITDKAQQEAVVGISG